MELKEQPTEPNQTERNETNSQEYKAKPQQPIHKMLTSQATQCNTQRQDEKRRTTELRINQREEKKSIARAQNKN